MDVKNYEVCFIYCKYSIYEVPLEVSLTSYVRCTVQSLVDVLSDILIRFTLARLHKNDSRVKIIPIEVCLWDCSLKETSKFLSITHTMIKCIKVDALYLLMSKCLDQIYICQNYEVFFIYWKYSK